VSGRRGARAAALLPAVAAGLLGLGLAPAACVPRVPAGVRAAPGAEAAPAPLAVMSFNIRYGTASDGDDSWPRRRELLFDVVREFGPDVLGLQEALRPQLDELRAALPGYSEVGVGRDDGLTAGEYAAILFRADRLELLASGTFWLSDTPEVPGSRSWGNNVTRICTWARFLDRAGGRTFAAYNVHLDHESQVSRERSVDLLLWRVRAAGPQGPVIVTGDFNAGEDNAAVRAMLAGGFADSFRRLHPADSAASTYHAFRGATAGLKIDFVFVSTGWTVADAAIVRTAREGRYPSDHFPVAARLVLGAAPGGR